MMIYGSLFSGIGGIDLGLDRAGMHCAWQVEIDPYCRRVLEKHWPDVPRFEDVRSCCGNNLSGVDLIAGGFPCQDLSQAGQRGGIDGEKSGLWAEFARIVFEVRPRFVLLENVAGLLTGGGMPRVLGDLAERGYDAEWDSISAHSVGAPHIRDRVFITAYSRNANSESEPARTIDDREASRLSTPSGVSDPDSHRLRLEREWGRKQHSEPWQTESVNDGEENWWKTRPEICGVADGIPTRLDKDRLKALGNAVVPQCAELVGRRILSRPQENA